MLQLSHHRQHTRLGFPARSDAYAQFQALKPYYTFNDVDVDRYVLDGRFRQVLIGARELNQSQLDSRELGEPTPLATRTATASCSAREPSDAVTASPYSW